jgi:hypothetical protein
MGIIIWQLVRMNKCSNKTEVRLKAKRAQMIFNQVRAGSEAMAGLDSTSRLGWVNPE